MNKRFVAAAFLAGLGGAASAATTTLDFTANNDVSGTFGGGYVVTGGAGNNVGVLSNTVHKTNLGCKTTAWKFDCTNNDVGFGVVGGNKNEVDGITSNEWVQVTFGYAVKVLGFAGMLGYKDSLDTGGYESVILQYLDAAGNWAVAGEVIAFDKDDAPLSNGNDGFNTVGLAWLRGLSIDTTAVRFKAGGKYPFDDFNANITAAGLEVAPVPVPASLPLLLAGIGGLGIAARRKRKSA